ncbi:beta-glucosidase [Brachybacterium sp. DNPG3]
MTASVWNDPEQTVDARVEALLADLTLEEKVGQLGSYWKRPDAGADADGADADGAEGGESGSSASGGGGFAPMQSTFDKDRDPFEAAIEHGLGHITRNFGSAPLSVDEGLAQLRELQTAVVAASRHGIPAIAHEECLTGFMAHGATTYPAAIAWGASFSPALVGSMAAKIGEDMAAVGIHHGLAPVLDIVRDYRWGRIEETMGEDPYLTGVLATSYVEGLQSAGVIATLKHFAGHAASRAGRNHAPVSIGLRELHDVDLVPFEMAVRGAGVRSVMNSYADIDGIAPAASRWLLTDLLRTQWGFDGTVVSDYWAVNFLESMHRVVGSTRDAAVTTLRAGMDVELPETSTFPELLDAIAAGEIAESELDTAVRRVLRQKVELGLLDPGFDPATIGSAIDLDSAAGRALARELAEESIVLVADDGILPLAPADADAPGGRLGAPARIALIGPAADDGRPFLGCYSFTNHVYHRNHEGTSVPVPTLAEALAAELPAAAITTVPGVAFLDDDASGIPAAILAAEAADLAILAVGDKAGMFGSGTSGEGCDVADLRLPGAQHELVEAVLATGTPVVLVLVTGRPYAIGEYADRCAAIVQAFMPGEEGGSAIAGVLSGRVNPSGRLPIGLPGGMGGQPGTYLAPVLGWISEGISNIDPQPLFPFGHGLGYSRFEYSDLRLESVGAADGRRGDDGVLEIAPDGEVEISALVTNASGRDGKEVVQLYLSDPVASVVRPLKRLVGFEKVAVAAGESVRVSFRLHADRASFVGPDLQRIVEPGELRLRLGRSSEDAELEGVLRVVGPTRVIEGARVLTTPVEVAEVSEAAARPVVGAAPAAV